MKIVFVDPATVQPYSRQTLMRQGLGGTEACVVRIAEALGQQHQVFVGQHNRPDDCVGESAASYGSMDHLDRYGSARPDAVILLRRVDQVDLMRQCFPHARLLLWYHVLPSRHFRKYRTTMIRSACEIIAISDFQRRRMIGEMQGKGIYRLLPGGALPAVHRIYDPIDDDLRPDNTPVDPDKLVFFSSPHKGLDQVLAAFELVRQRRETVRLYVANPGYMALNLKARPGVVVLGALSHRQVLQHVREAFCVFYPQTTFVETFGLIFAEANAVGTPVLAHPLGSAEEVLNGPRQLVDCRDPKQVVDHLLKWYEQGRPQVAGREQFRLSHIAAKWERLLRATAVQCRTAVINNGPLH